MKYCQLAQSNVISHMPSLPACLHVKVLKATTDDFHFYSAVGRSENSSGGGSQSNVVPPPPVKIGFSDLTETGSNHHCPTSSYGPALLRKSQHQLSIRGFLSQYLTHWGEIIYKDLTMVDYFLARVQLHGFLIFILYMKKPDTQAQFYW